MINQKILNNRSGHLPALMKDENNYPFSFSVIKSLLSDCVMSFSKFRKLLDANARREKKEIQDRMDKINSLHISLSGYLTKPQKKVIEGFRRDLEVTAAQMEEMYKQKLKEQEFLAMDREILFLEQLAKDPKTYGQEE